MLCSFSFAFPIALASVPTADLPPLSAGLPCCSLLKRCRLIGGPATFGSYSPSSSSSSPKLRLLIVLGGDLNGFDGGTERSRGIDGQAEMIDVAACLLENLGVMALKGL